MNNYRNTLESQRYQLLQNVKDLMRLPLFYLSFAWVGIIIVELTTHASRGLVYADYIIWGIFIVNFLFEFTVAPSKKSYLRENWLSCISLLLPALRVLQVFQMFRLLGAAGSFSLLKVVSSLNRGVDNLRTVTRTYGLRHILALTALVLFLGAAAILSFESPTALAHKGIHSAHAINNYGVALYWTAMLMTTIGSDYWPQTPEGRITAVLVSIYSLAIFGYVTAMLASILVKLNPGGMPLNR